MSNIHSIQKKEIKKSIEIKDKKDNPFVVLISVLAIFGLMFILIGV